MKSIRISNLRCLSDTGEIAMKPLMVLVGANSSGKSSFLRVFPLFKQSIEPRKRGPLLWFGPEVDFGSFDSSISRGKDTMHFEFRYDTEYEKMLPHFLFRNLSLDSLAFDICSNDNDDSITRLEIVFSRDQRIVIDAITKAIKITINNCIFESDSELELVSFNRFGILPTVMIRSARSKESVRDIIKSKINKHVKESIGRSIDDESLDRVFYDFYGSHAEMKDDIRKLFHLKKKEMTDEFFSYVNDIIVFAQIDDILESINSILRTDFENVSYIKPLRASAERYYRVQNFSVEELASDGHNMAMFLNELYSDSDKKKDFQKWTRDNFNFIVETIESNGHVSIKVKDEKNGDDNLADMGSGYAQLLPIIITLWQATYDKLDVRYYSRSRYGKRILAIEQPELHLHPSLQMRFADVLSSIISRSKKTGMSIIIETHSKEIINRIGIKVEDHSVEPEDVSVLLFDESHDVRTAHFNSAGVLQNWPIGFFDRLYY